MTNKTADGSFRITVINTASVNEFMNANNSFTNRLPQPVNLLGEWEVALDDISLSSSTKFANRLNPAKRKLFKMGHTRRARNAELVDKHNDIRKVVDFTHEDLLKVTNTVDGVGFMKSVVDFFEDKRIADNMDGNDVRYSHTVDSQEQRTYVKLKWEGNELVTDNLLTYKGGTGNWTELGNSDYDGMNGPKSPYFYIDENLAVKMGWFVWNEDNLQYDLGSNLRQELFDPNIIPPIQTSGDGDIPQPNTVNPPRNNSKQVFWTLHDGWHGTGGFAPSNNDLGFFQLSYNCNWRFVNLNAAFTAAVGTHHCTLMCYSDVGAFSVVGSQRTELLREFLYAEDAAGRKTGSVYFEPHR